MALGTWRSGPIVGCSKPERVDDAVAALDITLSPPRSTSSKSSINRTRSLAPRPVPAKNHLPAPPKSKSQSDAMDDNIIDGLRDAGCSEEFIELYGTAASDCARICLLKRHRRELLNDIHAGQQKLECLDYLIYRLRNASTGCCSLLGIAAMRRHLIAPHHGTKYCLTIKPKPQQRKELQ